LCEIKKGGAFPSLPQAERRSNKGAQKERGGCSPSPASGRGGQRMVFEKGVQGVQECAVVVPPLPLAGEGWGEGKFAKAFQKFCREMPLTRRAARAGLSRKRERRSKNGTLERRPRIASKNMRGGCSPYPASGTGGQDTKVSARRNVRRSLCPPTSHPRRCPSCCLRRNLHWTTARPGVRAANSHHNA